MIVLCRQQTTRMLFWKERTAISRCGIIVHCVIKKCAQDVIDNRRCATAV